MKITKTQLKTIIKEEHDAMVREADGEYYSGGMEPFIANARMPEVSSDVQASIDSLRKTPAFRDSMTFLNRVNMSQTKDEAAINLYREITKLQGLIEDHYQNLIMLNKKANRQIKEK